MTPDAACDQARNLVDRIRASLQGGHVREVHMVGAIAIMFDNAMAVAVHLAQRQQPAGRAALRDPEPPEAPSNSIDATPEAKTRTKVQVDRGVMVPFSS